MIHSPEFGKVVQGNHVNQADVQPMPTCCNPIAAHRLSAGFFQAALQVVQVRVVGLNRSLPKRTCLLDTLLPVRARYK